MRIRAWKNWLLRCESARQPCASSDTYGWKPQCSHALPIETSTPANRNRSGHPSTDYVSQEIIFVKNFERDTRRLCLRVQCPSVRGRQCRVIVEKLLYAFFNLSPILIGQRVSELSAFRIRWPLFSSGPLPRCPIIVFAIRVDSSLLTAHPLPCFIEFRF